MQAKTVAQESPAFVNALNGLPLVLMSEGGSANEVWKSIELGAVEYLEKPLSQLKLRNIWQHVVRKVCQSWDLYAFACCLIANLSAVGSCACINAVLRVVIADDNTCATDDARQ